MFDSKNEMNTAPRLAIVLPCFNESESIKQAYDELSAIIKKTVEQGLVAENSYLFFVDDGSTDGTWAAIEALHKSYPLIKGLKLSRNFGHQAALLSGLMAVTKDCDAAISIDADLQQDPQAIIDFVSKYRYGSDVVLGIRRDRGTDSWLKKQTALGFYKIMAMMGVKIIPNHADYRLLSKRALAALALYSEPGIFLRATCLQLGFRVNTIFFDVKERQFGQTKYSLKKMLQLALHGITSFSVVPLRLVGFMGFFLFLFSFVMGCNVVWHALFVGDTVPGWASTILPIYFIGGIQLLCLGVVGEYVGKIYTSVKNRPRWICEDKLE
jgi:glycosyltransferase involved in cell wall biosynthesis